MEPLPFPQLIALVLIALMFAYLFASPFEK
jgi:hypothetical protein